MSRQVKIIIFSCILLFSWYYKNEDSYSQLENENSIEEINNLSKPETVIVEKSEAFYNRGNSKGDLKDYKGAIADYTKAIEIDPDYAAAYNNRGNVKYSLGLNSCKDYSKSCELGYQIGCKYFNQDCK